MRASVRPRFLQLHFPIKRVVSSIYICKQANYYGEHDEAFGLLPIIANASHLQPTPFMQTAAGHRRGIKQKKRWTLRSNNTVF